MSEQRIVPNLWFDSEAQEAAKLYTSLFKNSRKRPSTQKRPGGSWSGGGQRDDGGVRARGVPIHRSQGEARSSSSTPRSRSSSTARAWRKSKRCGRSYPGTVRS